MNDNNPRNRVQIGEVVFVVAPEEKKQEPALSQSTIVIGLLVIAAVVMLLLFSLTNQPTATPAESVIQMPQVPGLPTEVLPETQAETAVELPDFGLDMDSARVTSEAHSFLEATLTRSAFLAQMQTPQALDEIESHQLALYEAARRRDVEGMNEAADWLLGLITEDDGFKDEAEGAIADLANYATFAAEESIKASPLAAMENVAIAYNVLEHLNMTKDAAALKELAFTEIADFIWKGASEPQSQRGELSPVSTAASEMLTQATAVPDVGPVSETGKSIKGGVPLNIQLPKVQYTLSIPAYIWNVSELIMMLQGEDLGPTIWQVTHVGDYKSVNLNVAGQNLGAVKLSYVLMTESSQGSTYPVPEDLFNLGEHFTWMGKTEDGKRWFAFLCIGNPIMQVGQTISGYSLPATLQALLKNPLSPFETP